jgi:cobalt-zinc-cadmium efflux system membrane fusion protein
VRLTDEVFQTRKVRLGVRDAHYTEVTAGVSAGEVVAAEGSHVLKSELLKSKLGAGCCDE